MKSDDLCINPLCTYVSDIECTWQIWLNFNLQNLFIFIQIRNSGLISYTYVWELVTPYFWTQWLCGENLNCYFITIFALCFITLLGIYSFVGSKVMKSGSLKLLEPSGPRRVCYGSLYFFFSLFIPLSVCKYFDIPSVCHTQKAPQYIT
jgi:hypothetical protein